MLSVRLVRRKLSKRRIWRRIFLERLTEPLHLNVLAATVWAFGSYRSRINWDLVFRQPYAYGILKAADLARENGFSSVTVIEFGVASGAGLMNMAVIAERVTRETGVAVAVHGFDTGCGMPPAVDYRDHPELYQQGDFAMDVERLRQALGSAATLHIGELSATIPAFLAQLDPDAPIGFVALDVDYYSSTVDAIQLFTGDPLCYLPLAVVYADDISLEPHNSASGMTLAIDEFNASTRMRRIEPHRFFETWRIFRRATWLKHIMFLHLLDHPRRCKVNASETKRYIENPWADWDQQRERFSVE